MKLFKRTKFFTLIELIVVIVVLGVLAAIVIPNISSFKEEAEEKAILADARNIQTAVDMYGLDSYGKTPTENKPTLGNPQIIEVYGLQPDYLRKTPKNERVKFWLDHNRTVWSSMVDAPTAVTSIDNENETVTVNWKTVDGAELYKVYQTNDAVLASKADVKGITYYKDVTVKSGDRQEIILPTLEKGEYLISAIDKFDFESAPTKVNTEYKGYGGGPSKDYTLANPEVPVNQKPVAAIKVTPATNIDTKTTLVWSSEGSTDPEGHELVSTEWKLDGIEQLTMPSTLTAGEHLIEMRVKDEKGSWSDWDDISLTVAQAFVWDTEGVQDLVGWSYSGMSGSKQHSYNQVDNTVKFTSSSVYSMSKTINPVTTTSQVTFEVELSASVAANYSYNLSDSAIYIANNYNSAIGFSLGSGRVYVVNGTTVKSIAHSVNTRTKYKVNIDRGTAHWYINDSLVHTAVMSQTQSWASYKNQLVLGDNANNSNYTTTSTYYSVNYSATKAF